MVNSQYFLVIIVVVVMGWFAFGVIYNLRRGEKLVKWMQDGLVRIGPRTTFRWLGTSVAEMTISQAKRPFRRLETLLVLAPRDVFWMVAIAAIQGRRDTLIFRGVLGTPPTIDLELADPRMWTGRTALREARRKNWETQEYAGMQLMTPRGLLGLATENLERLRPALDKLSARYSRISLRRTAAHMELHVPFPDDRSREAVEFFESLRALGEAIGQRS